MSTRYTKDHEWIAVENGIATVGITEHAQEQLGDLVYVELPEKGRTVAKGEEAVVVESVKAASDVYAPVSGEVTEANAELAGDPALVNRAAEGDGWLFRMKLADESELDGLMDRDAYLAMIG
ncbi:MAG: glycine cleavage system protein GcvH [Nitratireductor sp.]|nr:glycine cleavage system protein GcvH [Nitratireductor sp.]MCB1456470.1 glycine cleavage system protein GcvH [Nitratireductor sp.]MCB1458407.1 glycine cleavage system protein GcvH [Nitratireductor sp.]